MSPNPITIETLVNAPIETTWNAWNQPEHIVNWCFASPDWHCPAARNDLRTGGTFSTTMAARDKSFEFEFGGTYSEVVPSTLIRYTMGDGREVEVRFESIDGQTKITETFDPETQNPREMQQAGWQSILNNFRDYAETL